MAHGDDRGLRLPPRVAPQQVVIVPILREDDRADVLQAAAALADELRAAGVRVRVDDRPDYRPGFKFNEWELKGVPLRVEIGSRDLAAGAVTVARRDTGDKQQIPLPRAAVAIDELLSSVQASLFQTARDEQERRTLRDPSGYAEMIEYLREAAGFVAAPWCGQQRVRGARQGGQLGDDPVPAARRAAGTVRRLRLLRQAGGRPRPSGHRRTRRAGECLRRRACRRRAGSRSGGGHRARRADRRARPDRSLPAGRLRHRRRERGREACRAPRAP